MDNPPDSIGQGCDDRQLIEEHQASLRPDSDDGVCEDCDGRGWVSQLCICNGSGEGRWDGSICRECRGTGEEAVECGRCDGTGEIVEVPQDGDE